MVDTVDDIDQFQYLNYNSTSYLGSQIRLWSDETKVKSLTITLSGKYESSNLTSLVSKKIEIT